MEIPGSSKPTMETMLSTSCPAHLPPSQLPHSPIMKSVRRISVTEPFQLSPNEPIPEVPQTGARIKVHYAGVCFTDQQVRQSGKRPKGKGIMDTSLFPGFEVSGVIDSIGSGIDVATCKFKVGHRVIIYPDISEETEQGYAEYVTVKNIDNLVLLPDNLSLDVAATLPSGALTAYSAIFRIRRLVDDTIEKLDGKRPVHILVVGAGALGLWTVRMARHLLVNDPKLLHLSVGDTSVETLDGALATGCDEVIHWDESVYEEHLIARTKSVCDDGVDFIIDYFSSPRSIHRSLLVLHREGALVVGGHSKYEVPLCLHGLAQKQQTILGVSNGTKKQLETIVHLVAEGQIKPTDVKIFPVDDANRVFKRLNSCEIHGRAVLEVSPF